MAKPTDEYYSALGHFTQLFAETEWLMLRLLWETVGITDEMGKAVLSGIKIDQIGGLIERALAVSPVPLEEHKDLKYVLAQLGIINGVRNLIVHHGAKNVHADEGPSVVSNRSKTMASRPATVVPISATAINQMNVDLMKVTAHLVSLHLIPFKLRGKGRIREGHEEPFAAVLSVYDKIVRSPWRYRPPQPEKPVKADRAARKADRKRLVRQRLASKA